MTFSENQEEEEEGNQNHQNRDNYSIFIYQPQLAEGDATRIQQHRTK